MTSLQEKGQQKLYKERGAASLVIVGIVSVAGGVLQPRLESKQWSL